MISHSNSSKAGYTLLETLIVLALIGLVVGIAVSGFRGPAPAMVLQREASDLAQKATQTQLSAVTSQQARTLDIAVQSCDPDKDEFIFFPDGTAQGPDLCLTAGKDSGKTTLRLTLSALTGRLLPVIP